MKPEVGDRIARPRTYLNFILDESDSMDEVLNETVAAFNEFLSDQHRARIDELFVTLTLFSSAGRVRAPYTCLPIANVPRLDNTTYQPSGMTALYDGIIHSLRAIDKKVGRGDRVVNVLLTDGDENDSRATIGQLLAVKREYEARGNWSFIYLGTGSTARQAASKMGFRTGNTETYTEGDVKGAIVRVNTNLKTYRQADDLQTDTFFTPAKKWSRPQWSQSGSVVITDDN